MRAISRRTGITKLLAAVSVTVTVLSIGVGGAKESIITAIVAQEVCSF